MATKIKMADSINTHLGHYGEPKASAYLAKAILFYSRVFLFPFKVKWSERQRKYKLTRLNPFQMVIWTMFVFGNGISFLFWVSTSVAEIEEVSNDGNTMAVILVLICLLLTWLSVSTMLFIIWLRQEEILNFLQSIKGHEVLHSPSCCVWLCPAVFYCASSVTNLTSATGQMTWTHGSKMVTDGIICVLKQLGVVTSCSGTICKGLEVGLQAFFKLIIFHGGCFCSMPHTILLAVSIGGRQIGKEVTKRVQSEQMSVAEGLKLYEHLKNISSTANATFGAIMFTHYLCNLTYAIQTPFLFSEHGQIVEDVNYLLWLIVSGLIWWTGSEFHRLVQEAFRKWVQMGLSKEMCLDDRLKLSILANTIDKDAVGLYCRYFTVTHRFLTTTCGVVTTYGIIALQLQFKPITEICPKNAL